MTATGFIAWLRRFESWFGLTAAILIGIGLYTGLVTSSPDYYQGEVVRIMYVHVPFAQTAMFAYFTLFICSIWYLWKRNAIVDNAAHAAAGISLFFTAGGLVTGSIWGKPTWNAWWAWDPRLTSFAILFLTLIGYLMLRTFLEDQEKEATFSAILAIIGFVDLPIVHFSVEWWRSLHQPASISTRGVSIAPDMLVPFILMSIGIGLLFTYMLMVRTQMLYLEHLLEAKQGRFLSEGHP
ncbi:MAG: heme ABC transporter permease CcmC [Nitrospiria bacterium]